MTNDMGLLDENGRLPSISAAFLNPKGRVIADALVTRSPRHEAKGKPGYLVDCPLSVADSLKTHLKLYKLRSKVRIKDATALYDVLVSGVRDPWQAPEREGGGDVSPAAAGRLGDGAGGGREARFPDPRSAALGVRLIRPKDETGLMKHRCFFLSSDLQDIGTHAWLFIFSGALRRASTTALFSTMCHLPSL
ncbi:conserved unknown protein [Ectocarpus siliculosus]|uniref:Uncharacterized protein n=1 Tax=Ectocarpus siliculosus TaxID=2880 RepID=D7FL18_ECTSI|nr:conserved unknown protein [Ectocarpus siliculosus]|eukprot:CBJ34215.1 conserved unknown protein [Ectocarpus siliculosus]